MVVIFADFLLLFPAPAAKRLLDIAVGILAAYHETDLSGRIGWNGCVGILDSWEDLLAVCLEFSDQR